ncbi:hypothetical protein BDR22DRAFT_966649 [Usnea florida]
MASTKTVPPDWADKLGSLVYQAKLSAVTSDFAYFHASRAHYYSAISVDNAARLKAVKADPAVANKIKDINVTSAKVNETAMAELEQELKATNIDKSRPLAEQKLLWRKRIKHAGDVCKKKVTDRIDRSREDATREIEKCPEEVQDALEIIFEIGLQTVMGCVEYLVKEIEGLYEYIVDFLKNVWDELCLSGATPATQFLASLVYSFRVPDSEIEASTKRIWDEYLARYSEATTAQEPQSVTISRKPKPEGDRDTDGKLMFILWQADGAGSSNGRELMERVCQSEQKALAGSYSGGLRYNIVDLENLPKAERQTLGVGNKPEIEVQSRRREVQY